MKLLLGPHSSGVVSVQNDNMIVKYLNKTRTAIFCCNIGLICHSPTNKHTYVRNLYSRRRMKYNLRSTVENRTSIIDNFQYVSFTWPHVPPNITFGNVGLMVVILVVFHCGTNITIFLSLQICMIWNKIIVSAFSRK